MNTKTKTTRQPQKIDAESTDTMVQEEVTKRRTSSRVANKSNPVKEVKKAPLQKATRRRPAVMKSSSSEEEEVDSLDISPQKKSILMTPRTSNNCKLAEEVESLTISVPSRGRGRPPKAKPAVNLKQKVDKDKEKRTASPAHVTPEKKMKKMCSSDEDDAPTTATGEEEGALKGRVEEFNSLKTWILESKTAKTSLSIYVSGQPGTGKTATTMRVLQSLGKSAKSCVVNCASTNTKSALFKTIFTSLDLDGKPSVEKFEEHVKEFKVPLVLVLDEIDHLANRKNTALYAAFQWPDTLSYKIIILGIANSIDLTERLLPKLMLAKPPKRLVFEPYTKDDIVDILNDKMKNEETAVDAKAIELTARKVAAMSGDLRTALHIFKQQKSRMLPSEDNPPSTPLNGCREVLGIINSVYSSPLARARLPLQPRILLAVSLALSSNKSSSFDRNSLHRAYFKACEAIRVPALDDDDLHSAFTTLESQSFIRQLNGGKLVLQVDAPTAKSAISDNAMLDQIGLLHF